LKQPHNQFHRTPELIADEYIDTILAPIQGSSTIKSIDSGELIQAEPDALCSI